MLVWIIHTLGCKAITVAVLPLAAESSRTHRSCLIAVVHHAKGRSDFASRVYFTTCGESFPCHNWGGDQVLLVSKK